ncbi:Similar to mam: Neurogenic protein mastermind (Drosophila melanogaster) [Cotesia congregata]|uniref:Similar to mam: Neurogenic protein mastermind (Drosophila melanogaster) n=1 Tax=Cotesia congregata TaxID=51543 RepID=A0A8J2ELE6_COTCN|nr:Similar to mam: Neurogenic protein mastermind (Drosophila melanogaster) [Cotesia congregata]
MEAGGLLPHQPSQGPPGSGTGPGNLTICAGVPNRRGANHSPINPGLDHQQQQQQQHQLNIAGTQSGQLSLTSQQQLLIHQQMGQAPGIGEVLPSKKQSVVDRLKRRMDGYRKHQTECIPRFHQCFNGVCEQHNQDMQVLKQKIQESNKSKQRQAKTKADKKPNEAVGLSSIHVCEF